MTKTYILESGNPYIRKRTEKDWTVDFVFNKNRLDLSGGTINQFDSLQIYCDPTSTPEKCLEL